MIASNVLTDSKQIGANEQIDNSLLIALWTEKEIYEEVLHSISHNAIPLSSLKLILTVCFGTQLNFHFIQILISVFSLSFQVSELILREIQIPTHNGRRGIYISRMKW